MEVNLHDNRIVEQERDLNRLSKGNLTPESMMNKYTQGDASLLRLLFACGKDVVLERSPITETESKENERLHFEALKKKEKHDLVGAVSLKLKALREFAEMNTRRDIALAGMIKELTSRVPEKRILVYRGIAHRRRFLAELQSRSILFKSILGATEPLDKESELVERLANNELVSPAEVLETIFI